MDSLNARQERFSDHAPSPSGSTGNKHPFTKRIAPLALVLAAGCGNRSFDSTPTTSHETSPEHKAEFSSLFVSLERAFLHPLPSVSHSEVLFESAPITMHVNGLMGIHVGETSLEKYTEGSQTFLRLNIDSCHSKIPDTSVGLEVSDIVTFAWGQTQFFAMKFPGDPSQADSEIVLILPECNKDALSIDIFATMDLMEMTGELKGIETHFIGPSNDMMKLVLTGDPNSLTMILEVRNEADERTSEQIDVRIKLFD